MKFNALWLIILSGFVVSCGSSSGPSSGPRVQMTAAEANLQVEVYQEVQRYRTAQGRKTLDLSHALTSLAQEIAQERASAEVDPQFKLGSRGRTSARVIEAKRNLALAYISEAFYAGNQSAGEIVSSISRSPRSRTTLDGLWNQIGVGVTTSSSGTRHTVVITALKVRDRNINMPDQF